MADAVRAVLAYEGWRVVLCADGIAALRELESAAHYDLLLLDNDLPGIDGWQLLRHARTLPHRRRTPVVMLSAGAHEEDALRAGADAFLPKPEGVPQLDPTILGLMRHDY